MNAYDENPIRIHFQIYQYYEIMTEFQIIKKSDLAYGNIFRQSDLKKRKLQLQKKTIISVSKY